MVMSGYVLTRVQRDQIGRELGPAEIQITDNLFIGPVTRRQREGGMMHLNHSCEPNLGLQGQVFSYPSVTLKWMKSSPLITQ